MMLLANISTSYFITGDERDFLRVVLEIVQSYPVALYLFYLLGEDPPSLPITQLVVSFYNLSHSGTNSNFVFDLMAHTATVYKENFILGNPISTAVNTK